MSKSLGNGIDPLDVIEKYGADALRYTVVSGMAVGTDLILDPKDLEVSFAAGRNFANKLWNAARFVLGNLQGAPRPLAGKYREVIRKEELTLADRWIIARCEETVVACERYLKEFKLNHAAANVYALIWSDFADWYLEAIKPRLYGDVPGGDVARAVAYRIFDTALRLLHPVMPFITEAIWQKLPGRMEGELLAQAKWPESDRRAVDPEALDMFRLVQELVTTIRIQRAEANLPPGKKITVQVVRGVSRATQALEYERGTIERLAKLERLEFVESKPAGSTYGGALSDGSEVFLPLRDFIDVEKECAKLAAERDRLATLVANQEKKLGNEQFVSRAPAQVIEGERKKLAEWSEQVAKLDERRKALGCA
jgi:valyl-tRNA synthetase